MRKKQKLYRKPIFLVILVSLVVFIFVANFVVANWHCCKPEGCHDCINDIFGCNCELREKLGMEVCDDCKEAGCGMEHEEISCE